MYLFVQWESTTRACTCTEFILPQTIFFSPALLPPKVVRQFFYNKELPCVWETSLETWRDIGPTLKSGNFTCFTLPCKNRGCYFFLMMLSLDSFVFKTVPSARLIRMPYWMGRPGHNTRHGLGSSPRHLCRVFVNPGAREEGLLLASFPGLAQKGRCTHSGYRRTQIRQKGFPDRVYPLRGKKKKEIQREREILELMEFVGLTNLLTECIYDPYKIKAQAAVIHAAIYNYSPCWPGRALGWGEHNSAFVACSIFDFSAVKQQAHQFVATAAGGFGRWRSARTRYDYSA